MNTPELLQLYKRSKVCLLLEILQHWAIQERPYALLSRRSVVAGTSGRLIIIHRGLLGGFQMIDVRWQDLKDAKINEGIQDVGHWSTRSEVVHSP